mgnify:CR=1 FL=1
MVKKETFINICNLVDKVDARVDTMNGDLEKVLRKGFDEKTDTDSMVMIMWPLDAAIQMLEQILIDMGDSEEGADWFCYEAMGMIKNSGSAEMEVDGKEISFKSYGDYYDYLKKIYDVENNDE